MSNRIVKQENSKERTRVLKSHQVAGAGVAIPAAEQIADGDLPSSLSSGAPAELSHGIDRGRTPAEIHLQAAREAEERALALERRAAALLDEAEETALNRLNQVEEQIEELLARTSAAVAQAEADGRTRGHEEGFAEGYEAGLAQGKAEGEELLRKAKLEAESIRGNAELDAELSRQDSLEERSRILDAAKKELLDLAFAMARQILKAELTLRPEAILPMLEAALHKMKGESEPQIRVSPEVLAILEDQRGRLLAALPGARRIALEADRAMQPGDFTVQGGSGVVDGRLSEQVKLLEDAVREGR